MSARREQLVSELAEYGIVITTEQADLLVSYLQLVIEKNKVVNLTRITDPEDAVTLHLVDSLLPLACKKLDVGSDSHLLDMGTGAGFPGVPLAVVTKAQALLVDSVRKKVDAVSEFCQTLGLSKITTRHARLEELARELPCSQDYVFARAVARANVLLEYATPFLSMGGLLVVEKGRPEDEELEEADRAARVCGMNCVSRETFDLPRKLGHREILIYKRISKPQIKLPRNNGMARQKPLGVKKHVSREPMDIGSKEK